MCSIFTNTAKPQSLSLSVLVTMEMLKALSAVSVDNSLFRVPPWRNRWLVAGVALPSLIHMAALYIPAANQIFGLAPLSWDDWTYVLRFAVPILIVEEVLKAIGRKINDKKTAEQRLTKAALSSEEQVLVNPQQH